MLKVPALAKAAAASQSAKPDQNVLTAAKGGGIIFAGSLFQYAVRFVVGIVLARTLGVEQYGLYNLSMTVAAVASGLTLMGFTLTLVRYISLFASQRDTAKLWGTLQLGVGLPTVLSICAGIGLFALANPVAVYLFHEPRLAPLLRLGSLMIPFLALGDLAAAATRGFKTMHYTVIAQYVSRPVVKLILLGVFLITGLTVGKAVSAHVVSVIVASLMLVYFLNKLFSLKRPWKSARRETRRMLKFSLPLYVSYLIQTFRGNLQTVLLGALHTITGVGIFSVATQVNLIGQMFHSSVVTSSMPVISELYGRGKRKQMERMYQTTARWTFALNFPLFLIILMFPGQILSIFGSSFVDGTTALIILAWADLAKTGTGICGAVLDMTGRTRLKLVNAIIMSILMVGLNVLLIPRWGVIGAATATLTAVAADNILRLIEVYILFRLVPYNLSFLKPITAGLVAAGTVLLLGRLLPAEASLVYTAVGVITLLVVYAGVILLLGLSEEDRTVLARLRVRVMALFPRS